MGRTECGSGSTPERQQRLYAPAYAERRKNLNCALEGSTTRALFAQFHGGKEALKGDHGFVADIAAHARAVDAWHPSVDDEFGS
jgi:hypothetical protein